MCITLNGTTGITTPAIDNQGNLTVSGALNTTGLSASTAGLLTVPSGASIYTVGSGTFGLNVAGELTIASGRDNGGDTIVKTSNTERMRIDGAGRVTMPYQPAFLAIPTGSQLNFPINAQTTVNFANEIFDQGNNFSSNTFTAPVSGRYQFSVMLYANNMDTATDYYQCQLVTSNRTYSQIVSSNRYTADLTYYSFAVSILVDMDAGDTASVKIDVPNSGTAQLDLESTASRFSGYLVA